MRIAYKGSFPVNFVRKIRNAKIDFIQMITFHSRTDKRPRDASQKGDKAYFDGLGVSNLSDHIFNAIGESKRTTFSHFTGHVASAGDDKRVRFQKIINKHCQLRFAWFWPLSGRALTFELTDRVSCSQKKAT